MTKKKISSEPEVKDPAKRMRVGRPRSSASHTAILKATLDLLQQNGYRSVTIEGIASAAGVGKQTIYRWWSSKAAVILEAFTRYTAGRIEVPDSGSVKSDLKIFLTVAFDMLNRESSELVRGLMSEALLDAAFAEQMRDIFIASRRNALREILKRGLKRKELPADVDIEFLIDMIYGPMWYRLLNNHAPLDDNFAQQLAAIVTGGEGRAV